MSCPSVFWQPYCQLAYVPSCLISYNLKKRDTKKYCKCEMIFSRKNKRKKVANSAFRIPDSRFHSFHKLYKNMADSKFTFHRLLPLLLWVKPIATWKTVIESMQSLGMDNFRVAYTRFLAFYSDNPSGLHVGETPAKWQSKASFATHPSTETGWPPKRLTRFSRWRIELHNDMQESL